MVHRPATGVLVLVVRERQHAHHEQPGHAARLGREVTLKALGGADELRFRLRLLRQRIEDDALGRVLRRDLQGIGARRPADGDGVVEVDRPWRRLADVCALQAVLGEDERLRRGRDVEHGQDRSQVAGRPIEGQLKLALLQTCVQSGDGVVRGTRGVPGWPDGRGPRRFRPVRARARIRERPMIPTRAGLASRRMLSRRVYDAPTGKRATQGTRLKSQGPRPKAQGPRHKAYLFTVVTRRTTPIELSLARPRQRPGRLNQTKGTHGDEWPISDHARRQPAAPRGSDGNDVGAGRRHSTGQGCDGGARRPGSGRRRRPTDTGRDRHRQRRRVGEAELRDVHQGSAERFWWNRQHVRVPGHRGVPAHEGPGLCRPGTQAPQDARVQRADQRARHGGPAPGCRAAEGRARRRTAPGADS